MQERSNFSWHESCSSTFPVFSAESIRFSFAFDAVTVVALVAVVVVVGVVAVVIVAVVVVVVVVIPFQQIQRYRETGNKSFSFRATHQTTE